MTVAHKNSKWTIDEFLAWHKHQEHTYELIDGGPVLKREAVAVTLPGASAPMMMTGASRRHNKVNGNLLRLIGNQLQGSSCGVFANDAAVRTGPNQIRYPDLIVDCDTKLDEGFLFESPKLVVEILSPSTKSFDLAGKITEYWQISTISHVLIVDPEKFRVQLHTRHSGQTPTLRIFADADDAFDVPELGLVVRLADIFAGLAPVAEQ